MLPFVFRPPAWLGRNPAICNARSQSVGYLDLGPAGGTSRHLHELNKSFAATISITSAQELSKKPSLQGCACA